MRRAFLALAALAFAAGVSAQQPEHEEQILFAAASLQGALDEVHVAFRGVSGRYARISYGASGTLARQIENGAPAAIFISADSAWMDHLERAGKILPGSRSNLLGNQLVLVAPATSDVRLEMKAGAPLAQALGAKRLAIGAPETVPAGRYAREALTSLGLWSGVEAKLAPVDNVRVALALVARGEAPLGIVYRTDALAEPKVRIVSTFPEGSHAPIVYPIALTTAAKNSTYSARFLRFARQPPARAAFEKHGFRVLD